MTGRGIALLARQGLQLMRAPHALRWRLETFGTYMPSYPHTRKWWRVNARALRTLILQMPAYVRWLAAMQTLRQHGAAGYWRARSGRDLADWEKWLAPSTD